MIQIILWALIQLGVIGLLWSMPLMFWGKVLLVGIIGLVTLKKLV
jgi:hypothetical protein